MDGRYIHFDWIIGDVDLCVGDAQGSVQLYLSSREARTLGRRLAAWADWRDARKRGEAAKQPGNSMMIAAPMNRVRG